MESLIINGTDDTPSVELNKEDGIFSISGMSLPENVTVFYRPIVEWFKKYFKDPNEHTRIRFSMIYFNTASSKMILDIFEQFRIALQDGHDVSIIWAYEEDDEEMCESGEDFAEIIGIEVKVEEVAVT